MLHFLIVAKFMNIGFLFAFGAALSWSIAGFYITHAAKHLPIPIINILRLTFGVGFVIIAAVIINPSDFVTIFSKNYIQAWLWLGLSGIIALVIGDYLSFKSYAILQPQKASVLTTLSPTTALAFGILLLDEKINIIGIIGIVITIVGVMSISLGRSQRNAIMVNKGGNANKAILYGVLAAACHGLALAFSKKGLVIQRNEGFVISPINASFIRLFVAFLFIVLIAFATGKMKQYYQKINDHKQSRFQTIVASLFNPSLAVSLSMFSILYMDVAVAQTIFSFVPFFTLLIAFFVIKEKVTLQSLIGVLVAIVGVAILIWRMSISNYFGW
jgi:drug/metabolite transporter (DMT)-like permease